MGAAGDRLPACYHPNPIDGAVIAELVRERKLTLLFATPTFLLTYMPKAKEDDFQSLRLVVTGAEKLKKKAGRSLRSTLRHPPAGGLRRHRAFPGGRLQRCRRRDRTDSNRSAQRTAASATRSPASPPKWCIPTTGEDLGTNEEGLLLIKGPMSCRAISD